MKPLNGKLINSILVWRNWGVLIYNCVLCLPLILISFGINDPLSLISFLIIFMIRSFLINYVIVKRLIFNGKDKTILFIIDVILFLMILVSIKGNLNDYDVIHKYIIGISLWAIFISLIYNVMCRSYYHALFNSIIEKRIPRIRKSIPYAMKTSLKLSFIVFIVLLIETLVIYYFSDSILSMVTMFPKSSLFGSLLHFFELLFHHMSYPNLSDIETISLFISLLSIVLAMELSFYIASIIHTERFEFINLLKPNDAKAYMDGLNMTGKRINRQSYALSSLICGLSSNNIFVETHAHQDLYYMANYSPERKKLLFSDTSGISWDLVILGCLKNIVNTTDTLSYINEYYKQIKETEKSMIEERLMKIRNIMNKFPSLYDLTLEKALERGVSTPQMMINMTLITYSCRSLSQLIYSSIEEDEHNIIELNSSVIQILESLMNLLRQLECYISNITLKTVQSHMIRYDSGLDGNLLAHSWAYPMINVVKKSIYQIIISIYKDIPNLTFTTENAMMLQEFVDFIK